MGVALADELILAPNPSFGNGWAFFDACGIPCETLSDKRGFGWIQQSKGTDVASGVSYPELALDKRVAVLLKVSEWNKPRRPPGYETIQKIPIDSKNTPFRPITALLRIISCHSCKGCHGWISSYSTHKGSM